MARASAWATLGLLYDAHIKARCPLAADVAVKSAVGGRHVKELVNTTELMLTASELCRAPSI